MGERIIAMAALCFVAITSATTPASASTASTASTFATKWRPELGEALADAALEQRNRSLATDELQCELAVIGAGWGGAYFAWRMAVDSQSLNASHVCVFEANGRVGGRVYSVRNVPHLADLSIDVGGYRFIETDKLSSQLVWDALKLPTACYDWDCAPSTKPFGSHILKDAYGNNAGYATPVEVMLGQLEALGAGDQVMFAKTLTGIYEHEDRETQRTANQKKRLRLTFADGTTATTSKLLLNIPRNALERLDRKSVLFERADAETREYLEDVVVNSTVKVYVVYEDAW